MVEREYAWYVSSVYQSNSNSNTLTPNHNPIPTLTLSPEPGKRSLILGINGFGNLAGIIGAELFRKSYAPKYRLPFYVTLGLLVLSMCGYLGYIFLLKAVNRWRRRQISGWTETEREEERTGSVRYGDRKRVFVYGI